MATTTAPLAGSTGIDRALTLERNFRRFDVTFFAVCTVIGLDTIGAVASDGAQAFTWMVFLGVVFFLPYALLTAELGAAFPAEGGPYVWIRLAFGRLAGSVSSFGAFLRAALLTFFTISVIIYAARHGVHGFSGGAFKPTYAVFIVAVPVLAFNYVGVEVPSAAAEEIHDPQRTIPASILRSGVMVFLLYAIPILAIILLLPTGQVTNLGGFIDAIKTVLTVYGGHVGAGGAVTLNGAGKALGDVVAIGFILALMTGSIAWLMGADRAQAIAARHGSAPRWLGRFSPRFGTPIAVNLMSGAMATVFLVLALVLTHGNAAKYFSAVLGLVISTTLISYVAICPAVIRLHYSHGDTPRPYRLPFGTAGAWICGLLGTVWALFATVVLVWPGLGTSDPASALPTGFTHERLQSELTQLVSLAAIVALGVAFYVAGGRRATAEPRA